MQGHIDMLTLLAGVSHTHQNEMKIVWLQKQAICYMQLQNCTYQQWKKNMELINKVHYRRI